MTSYIDQRRVVIFAFHDFADYISFFVLHPWAGQTFNRAIVDEYFSCVVSPVVVGVFKWLRWVVHFVSNVFVCEESVADEYLVYSVC